MGQTDQVSQAGWKAEFVFHFNVPSNESTIEEHLVQPPLLMLLCVPPCAQWLLMNFAPFFVVAGYPVLDLFPSMSELSQE